MSDEKVNAQKTKMNEKISGTAVNYNHIKYVIAVMSGKGGVGKSFITGLLASILAKQGYKVGLLDADITGPSIPKLFGLHGPVEVDDIGITPLKSRTGIKIMSMNLLLEKEDQPVIWRGPLVSQGIKQLYGDVSWGELDFLLVDLPPGTSDATLTIMQSLPLEGIVMVTTPQSLSALVVSKAVHMAQKLDVSILGIVENMAYYICPDTGKKHFIFGASHVNELMSLAEAPLLARMPIDPKITQLCDNGQIEDVVLMENQSLFEAFIGRTAKEDIIPDLRDQTTAPIIEDPYQNENEVPFKQEEVEEEIALNDLSDKAKQIIVKKENWGVLEAPDMRVRIRGCCGDSMQIDLKVDNVTIQDAHFLTDGCGPSIAAAGMVCRIVKGKTISEALNITQKDVLDQLDGLPSNHQHCAKLAVMTLQQAINNYLSNKSDEK